MFISDPQGLYLKHNVMSNYLLNLGTKAIPKTYQKVEIFPVIYSQLAT